MRWARVSDDPPAYRTPCGCATGPARVILSAVLSLGSVPAPCERCGGSGYVYLRLATVRGVAT